MEYIASTMKPFWHEGAHVLGYVFLILIVVLAFEIWMLVDVIKNRHVPTKHKVWWIVGMLLIHPIVAIVYFFVSRLHYNKQKSQK
jgi:heme/copper-type cytochrome/quinol oxidase subunit 4